MKVLLIGGTGLVGPPLLQELNLNRIVTVCSFNRTGTPYYWEQVIKGDRKDSVQILRALEQFEPDIVVDMVAFELADAAALSQALKQHQRSVKLVVASSIDVYAAYATLHATEPLGIQTSPIDESMPLRSKLGQEGLSYDKLAIEKHYMQTLEHVCVLRLPAIYGWPDCTRVEEFTTPMLCNEPVIKLDENYANWKFSRAFHRNVAFAISLVLQSEQLGQHVFNVADTTALSTLEWAEKIALYCGWQGEFQLVSNGLPQSCNWLQNFDVSSHKIRSTLGYTEKYSSDEGLKEMLSFIAYRKYGKPYKKAAILRKGNAYETI